MSPHNIIFVGGLMLKNVKHLYKYSCRKICSKGSIFKIKKPPWKVLFFGSDEFSLYSLKELFNKHTTKTNLLNTVDVVTNSRNNPVWKFADKHNLKIYRWPPALEKNAYDLGLVVSFGHLIPESLIDKFPLGMLNVHASLLPKWRGASPIIFALANGDTETGVTIMRIRPKKFDIGEIVTQETVSITPDMDLPVLHNKLGQLGAQCLLKTVCNLEEHLTNCRPQPQEGITYAPKVTPEFAQIKWHLATSRDIYNLQRALNTFLPLTTTWNSIQVKLIDIKIHNCQSECKVPGFVEYDKQTKTLIVECARRTWISVEKVGVQGKKVMTATDFKNGFIKKQPSNKICCFV